MKRNHILAVIIVLLLVGMVLYFWPRSVPPSAPPVVQNNLPAEQPKPIDEKNEERPAPVDPEAAKRGDPVRNEPDRNAIRDFTAALMKPISFFGKVVDEKSNPVEGASVSWGASNNPDPYGSGTKGQKISDAAGMFSIQSNGVGLYVEVSKPGYHRVPTQIGGKRGSYGNFSNAAVRGNTDSPMGTQTEPAVFVLRKMGEAVALVKVENFVKVPRNGSPVEISLETGRAVAAGQGDLKVEAWTNDQTKDTQGHYDWKFRISVPGGGLIERKDGLAFEAPANDYRPADEIVMPQTAEKWNPQASRQYFVKLADNLFARVEVEMVAGGDHFFSITSYLNPTPGSRNLEYDPAKAIQP